MAKAKVKKQDTFIDMTAMSDVTVLLLTFFMFTSTFRAIEPVQVTTPASVSEIPIPEQNLVTILVEPNGKIFMSFANDQDKVETLTAIGEDYGIAFSPKQTDAFRMLKSFGVAMQAMATFLDLPPDVQATYLQDLENQRVGIPTDALMDERGVRIAEDNEFKRWISHAVQKNSNLQIAIKADKSTNYLIVKKVIDDVRELRKNRFLLITSLKTASNA